MDLVTHWLKREEYYQKKYKELYNNFLSALKPNDSVIKTLLNNIKIELEEAGREDRGVLNDDYRTNIDYRLAAIKKERLEKRLNDY